METSAQLLDLSLSAFPTTGQLSCRSVVAVALSSTAAVSVPHWFPGHFQGPSDRNLANRESEEMAKRESERMAVVDCRLLARRDFGYGLP